MHMQEYTDQALRTLPSNADAIMPVLGLAGEVGEVVELIKKHIYHGRALDVWKLRDELGDVLWYLAAIAHTHNLTLEEISQRNIEKLHQRYPEGFVKGGGVRNVSRR